MNREMRRKQKKIKSNEVVLSNKGKDYSSVTNEVEDLFNRWLYFSNYDKEYFLRMLNSDGVHIQHEVGNEKITISIIKNNSVVGTPFIWVKENGIPLKNFWIDVLLLLTYISSMCDSENVLNDIKMIKALPTVKKYF